MYTIAEIEYIIEQIAIRARPEKIILFGSYAKGTATMKSDLDLFIIKETELPMKLRNAEIRPLINHLLIHVDVHVYTPEEVAAYSEEEYSFVRSVLKTGKVMFENNKDRMEV